MQLLWGCCHSHRLFHLHTIFRKSVPCSDCRASRTFWKIQGRTVPEYYSQGISGQMFSTNCSQILYTHSVVNLILQDRKAKYVRLSMNYGCVVDSGGVKIERLYRVWEPGSPAVEYCRDSIKSTLSYISLMYNLQTHENNQIISESLLWERKEGERKAYW